MGVIIRLGNSGIGRRLVRKPPRPAAEERENGDGDDPPEPAWCADCDREVLLEQPRCDSCGGEAVTAPERARRRGDGLARAAVTDLPVSGEVATVLVLAPEPPSGQA